jgi:hypothetical protein
MFHRTRDFFAFAGTASAVFAAIRQAYALANAGRQNDFVGGSGKGAATGLYGDVECHTVNLVMGQNSQPRGEHR